MAKPVFKSTKNRKAELTSQIKAGEDLFREGDLGTVMYILQEGQVEILKSIGGEEQQLAVLEKGDFFGEMSLLEDLPRTATARALSDCTIFEINGSTFDQMLRSNPEIAVRMMRKLSRRLRQTDQLLKEALGTSGEALQVEVPTPSGETIVRAPQGPRRLVHPESDTEFFLSEKPETLVGRRDPVTGIHPEVDLTPIDVQRSTSRRHAKILYDDGQFYANEEIGTMNGTFVNGVRLETGVPMPFQPGDEVQFGLCKLVFRVD